MVCDQELNKYYNRLVYWKTKSKLFIDFWRCVVIDNLEAKWLNLQICVFNQIIVK